MYVIMMKDKDNGLYLSEQILFYVNLADALKARYNMAIHNRDTMYQIIRVDLQPAMYEEYEKRSHDIIYEGLLYNDIDKCIIEGKYDIVNKSI